MPLKATTKVGQWVRVGPYLIRAMPPDGGKIQYTFHCVGGVELPIFTTSDVPPDEGARVDSKTAAPPRGSDDA